MSNVANENGVFIDVKTLSGHTSYVRAISTFFDEKTQKVYVVSGSWDNTVKVWDALGPGTNCVKTLSGHTGYILVVSTFTDEKKRREKKEALYQQLIPYISKNVINAYVLPYTLNPPSTTVVSGSHDKTVKLWELQSIQKAIWWYGDGNEAFLDPEEDIESVNDRLTNLEQEVRHNRNNIHHIQKDKEEEEITREEKHETRIWKPDHARDTCYVCNGKFRVIINPKSHFRACGQLICKSNKCSFQGKGNPTLIGVPTKVVREMNFRYDKICRYCFQEQNEWIHKFNIGVVLVWCINKYLYNSTNRKYNPYRISCHII